MSDKPSASRLKKKNRTVRASNARDEITPEEPNEITPEEPNEITPEELDEITPEELDETTPEELDETTLEEPNETTPENPNETTSEKSNDTTPEKPNETTTKEQDKWSSGNKQGHPAALDAILQVIRSTAEAKQVKQAGATGEPTTAINWGELLSKEQKATIISIKEVNNSRIVTDPNILHEIARREGEFNNSFHSFVEWLLGRRKLSSILLQQKSKLYHRRPLQLALENGNSDFVKMILDNFGKRKACEKGDILTLAGLLKPESPHADEMNCIHLAIEARSPHTIEIIEICKDCPETFKQLDSEKRKEMPLHLAAVCGATTQPISSNENEFNALDVVKTLIQRYPDALYATNANGETPYRSRIRALGNLGNKTATGTGGKVDSEEQIETQQFGELIVHDEIETVIRTYYEDPADNVHIENTKNTQKIATSKENNITSKEEDAAPKTEDTTPEAKDTTPEAKDAIPEAKDVTPKTEDATPEAKDITSKAEDATLEAKDTKSKAKGAISKAEDITPEAEDIVFKEEDATSKEEDEKLRKEVIIEDPILCAIRAYCVKKMDRFILVKALYQGAQERETYFDLSILLNPSISQSYLEALGHLKFESILGYVALPRITITDQKTSVSSRGRRDMVKVFEWLRKKQVKKILSVIVIDNIEPSHSDGAIEEALGTKANRKTFDIETWDWKKLDINCDVIAHCAPNGLEDPGRLRSYVEDFKNLVKSDSNKNGNPVTVKAVPDKKEKSYMEGFEKGNSAVKSTERQHKWLENSSKFRKIMWSLDDTATEVRPIKIAIIDNGVDAALKILSGKIETGASFFPNQNTGNAHYYPYYVTSDTLNHGSLVATLVCTMCPKVKLYICRLDEKMSPTGARYITMESATEAVKWATGQRVDVICMSWTIEDNIKNVDAQNKLGAALSEADKKGIIMVSSASDQGGNSAKTWPGESGSCIRIGASTETGDKSFQVHRGDMEFLFPGEEVPLGVNEEHLSRTTYDGSSVATAIAAGTAGLLLYLDRLAQKWGGCGEQSENGKEGSSGKESDNKKWVPLKGKNPMKKVFENMSMTHVQQEIWRDVLR